MGSEVRRLPSRVSPACRKWGLIPGIKGPGC